MELTDHLFRHEAGRMVVVLTRLFGVHNLALAEDVVQDAFCRALEVWAFRGVPENPSAWLMAAAKNRALDVLRRERTVRTYEPELTRSLGSEWTLAPVVQEMFTENSIKDDQLRMMFSCCHPRLPEEAQVMLILHILCGFGVDEVASAFVATYTAVEKRIPRAKKVLAGSKRLFDTQTPSDVATRLPAVQRALYLLFNEGYHGASAEFAVRAELCGEAMRLAALLLGHPLGATPATYALSALMCLNKARLPARLDASGKLNSLFDQDRSLWDQKLVSEGLQLLDLSANGSELSEYHVEAGIAAVHASAPSVQSTNWEEIVSLYNTLMTIRPTPIVALNRAIAIGQLDGPKHGLEALRRIADSERLAKYPFYEAAFSAALALSRNPQESHFFSQRVEACGVSAQIRKN
jgi:RNA polymerase sigma factor (sigma-70 family)